MGSGKCSDEVNVLVYSALNSVCKLEMCRGISINWVQLNVPSS